MNASARNVISSWIVLDEKENSTLFPQAGVRPSADPQIHLIYWRCIAVFFATVSRSNPEARLRLYTNAAGNMDQAPDAVLALLQRLHVEVVVVPLRHLPPSSYVGRWRNQFYILDLMEAMAAETEPGNHLVLDSDCLVFQPLHAMFSAMQREGTLTLDVQEPLGADINGLTREQMHALFRELGGCDLKTPPLYLGGELFAATTETVRAMVPVAESAWTMSLARAERGLSRLTDEAHLLSYVYYRMGFTPGTADAFMKRLWTNRRLRDGKESDRGLSIIHVPGEKMFGFPKLYRLVVDTGSWFYSEADHSRWVSRIQQLMSIPRPNLLRLGAEVVNSLRNHAMRRLGRA